VFDAHPAVKLAMVLQVFLLSFIFDNPAYLGILLLNICVLCISAGIGKQVIQLWKFMAYVSIFFLIITMLLNENGVTVLFRIPTPLPLIGDIIFTFETLVYAFIHILRFNIVFLGFVFMNYTISPDDLMRILLKIRLPYQLILIVVLTIRFLPILLQDLQIIGDVQQARGYELEKGNLFNRLKRRMTLILPLLSNSLERSIQSSEALEARGFSGQANRTVYKPLIFTNSHYIQLTLVLGLTVYLLYSRTQGWGTYIVYPLIVLAGISYGDIMLFSILIGFLGLILILFRIDQRELKSK
jgi:energy-coupling factor transport system permease protein